MNSTLARLAMLLTAACSNHALKPDAQTAVLRTPRGEFHLTVYAAQPKPEALALLASGDGGWTDFEEKMARTLAAQGCRVIGWDCRNYAKLGAYDRNTLCKDANAALAKFGKETGGHALPVILVGFSTGAEQMVSVAASKDRPHGLRGLLILAPGHRGRYGIELSDLMGLSPKGPNTFSLEEMAPGLDGLRIFQIHGEHDPLAQTGWLDYLRAEHKLKVYPNGWHLFRGGPPDFQKLVSEGAAWILHD